MLRSPKQDGPEFKAGLGYRSRTPPTPHLKMKQTPQNQLFWAGSKGKDQRWVGTGGGDARGRMRLNGSTEDDVLHKVALAWWRWLLKPHRTVPVAGEECPVSLGSCFPILL